MLKVWMMILLFVMFGEDACAQFSSKDSLWLIDMLSNNKEIQLKPEVLEAIKSGNLINLDNLNSENQLRVATKQLPLFRDFTQYIQNTDTAFKKIDHTTIPPGVLMLYFNSPVAETEKLKSFSLAGIENYTADRPQPILITDPLAKGQASGGAKFMICLNDIVEYYILKKRD